MSSPFTFAPQPEEQAARLAREGRLSMGFPGARVCELWPELVPDVRLFVQPIPLREGVNFERLPAIRGALPGTALWRMRLLLTADDLLPFLGRPPRMGDKEFRVHVTYAGAEQELADKFECVLTAAAGQLAAARRGCSSTTGRCRRSPRTCCRRRCRWARART